MTERARHGPSRHEHRLKQMATHLSDAERQRVAALTLALYERGGLHGVRDDEYEAFRERLMELVARLSDY